MVPRSSTSSLVLRACMLFALVLPAASQICDLAKQAGARQSTFFDTGLPASNAVDGDLATCIRTLAPVIAVDPNPQWFRVDLGLTGVNASRVGTVRIASDPMFPQGLSYFSVWASIDDAQNNTSEWIGPEIPATAQLCYSHPAPVTGPGQEVFEIECAKPGRYVYVTRGEAAEALRLCSVEVFDHTCESEPFECGLGQQPITTSCAQCPGCMSCPAGTYSDEISNNACLTCPLNAYSPPGSTSVFACEGYRAVEDDGTSYFELDQVRFMEATNRWELDIVYKASLASKVSGLFLSKAGEDYSFSAKNFPCGVSPNRDPWLITGDEETLCCLKQVRQDYTLTQPFRAFSDSLDLDSAADVCDGPTGSTALIGVNVDVVGASGSDFLDSDGNSFAAVINALPPSCDLGGLCNVTITIPDSELAKISRPVTSTRRRNALPDQGVANLADAREIFVGMFDLMPTGGRIVTTGSQQVSVVLSKTNFGGLSAFGSQSIDYTFLSFLNVRAHKVIDRNQSRPDAFFAAVEFMYDGSLSPLQSATSLVSAVDVGGTSSCNSAIAPTKQGVFSQACGPDLDFTSGSDFFCPVVSIPASNFGQVYIPLESDPTNSIVNISFMLALQDAAGLNTSLKVSLILSPKDVTTWCAGDSKTTDLAGLMVPTMMIGISDGPIGGAIGRNWMPFEVNRTAAPASAFDLNDVNLNSASFNQASGLHDGLLTLVLSLGPDENVASTANMEVFIEDIVTIHVNPGALVTVDQLRNAYKPSFTYDRATGDARVEMPELIAACPSVDSSPSFFGCTHKHIINNKAVVDDSAAYIIGTGGAEAFMAKYLEGSTATAAAQRIGAQFEAALLADKPQILDTNTVACWINPGHKWGTDTPSVFSLSQDVLVYVLYGVKAGATPTRRMIMEVGPQTASSFGAAVHYPLDTAVIVAAEYSLPEDLVQSFDLTIRVDQTEACLPDSELKTLLEVRLMDLMAPPHSSGVRAVKVLSMGRDMSSCSQRRSELEVALKIVVALEESLKPFIDWQALKAASAKILNVPQQQDSWGHVAPDPDDELLDPNAVQGSTREDTGSSRDYNLAMMVGISLGGIILCLIAWLTYTRLSSKQQPADASEWSETETSTTAEPLSKIQVEAKLFFTDSDHEIAPRLFEFPPTPSSPETSLDSSMSTCPQPDRHSQHPTFYLV